MIKRQKSNILVWPKGAVLQSAPELSDIQFFIQKGAVLKAVDDTAYH